MIFFLQLLLFRLEKKCSSEKSKSAIKMKQLCRFFSSMNKLFKYELIAPKKGFSNSPNANNKILTLIVLFSRDHWCEFLPNGGNGGDGSGDPPEQ